MVVLQGWCFELGFMPSKHYSGSDTSRPQMGITGIMNRARGMQFVENGIHVRIMFLLLGLLLSVVNLPTASGENEALPSAFRPLLQPPSPPPPATASVDPPISPPTVVFPPPPVLTPPPVESPPPPTTSTPTTIVKTSGNTWNKSEKAGVVIASIAALLQVAVVAFLLIKRHQMLTTVEYDDIDDLEYDTPRDSNSRDIESA